MQSTNTITSTKHGKNQRQQPKPFENFQLSKFSVPKISVPVLSLPKMQIQTKSLGKEVNSSKPLPTSLPPPMTLFSPPYQDGQWWSSMSTTRGNEQPEVKPRSESAPEKPSSRWTLPSLPKVNQRPSAAVSKTTGTKKDESAPLHSGNLRGIRSGIMNSSDRKPKLKPQKPETKPPLEQPCAPETKLIPPEPATKPNPQPGVERLILEQQELIQQLCLHQENLVLEQHKAIELQKKLKSIIAEQKKVIATQKLCCSEQQAVIDKQCQHIVKQKKELDALRRPPQPTIVGIPPRKAVAHSANAMSMFERATLALLLQETEDQMDTSLSGDEDLKRPPQPTIVRIPPKEAIRRTLTPEETEDQMDTSLSGDEDLKRPPQPTIVRIPPKEAIRRTLTPEDRKDSASVLDREDIQVEDNDSCSCCSDVGLSMPKPTLKRVASKAA